MDDVQVIENIIRYGKTLLKKVIYIKEVNNIIYSNVPILSEYFVPYSFISTKAYTLTGGKNVLFIASPYNS